MGPLTYGRILPVHLNSLLYGWIGLLCLHFLRGGLDVNPQTHRNFDLLVQAWSFTIALGQMRVLSGHSSGKLFLEFEGWSRFIFIALLTALSLVLLHASKFIGTRQDLPFYAKWGLRIVAYGSPCLPLILVFASSDQFYPPINPDTGGPTGFDLMGSTVVIIPFLILLPRAGASLAMSGQVFLNSPKILTASSLSNLEKWIWGAWVVHLIYFIAFPHGSASHRDWREQAAMLSLWLWIGLLGVLYQRHPWAPAIKIWVLAFLLWFAILTTTATLMFFPGWLDAIKFTSNLVAHAHLAMAGMCSSAMLLYGFMQRPPSSHESMRMALLWNGSVVLLVLSFISQTRPGSTLTTTMAAGILPLRACACSGLLIFFVLAYRHFSGAVARSPA